MSGICQARSPERDRRKTEWADVLTLQLHLQSRLQTCIQWCKDGKINVVVLDTDKECRGFSFWNSMVDVDVERRRSGIEKV